MGDSATPLGSIADVLRGANFTAASADFYSDVLGFYHAVDWSERWLLVLGAFHVFVWIVTVLLRRADEVQMVLLVLIRAHRPASPHPRSRK